MPRPVDHHRSSPSEAVSSFETSTPTPRPAAPAASTAPKHSPSEPAGTGEAPPSGADLLRLLEQSPQLSNLLERLRRR